MRSKRRDPVTGKTDLHKATHHAAAPMRRAAAVVAAFGLAFSGVVAAPGVSSAETWGEPAIEVHRGDWGTVIFVKFWPVATTLTATLDDPATVVFPDYQTTFDATPTDNDGIGGGFGVLYEAKPGDIVTLTDGTTTKSHTVIDINVVSVDVDADHVTGTVPTPGSAVTVYVSDAATLREITADASGSCGANSPNDCSWMADYSVPGGPDQPPFDIVAGTSGGAEQFDADGDSTVYDWQVPRPYGWQHNPATDHYYLYVEDGMSWADAEAHAASLGGHLVTINDSAENDWLVATLGTEYWIGFNDIADEGEWVWASGEPVSFTDWLAGEPNNYLGEDAAMIWNRPPIGWNDVPDSGAMPFVVEAEVAPPSSFFSVSPIAPPEHMWGEGWAPDSEVTIEIDDPDVGGAVDFSTTTGTDDGGRFELYGIPFDIEAGHVVTVSQGTTAKTHVVIDLTVTLMDPVADTVRGIGKPNTETVVNIWDSDTENGSQTVVMSGNRGEWTADFSGAFDILPGMMTYTYQADEDGDQTQIDAWPPSFLVFRDWNGLAGWGWPAGVDVQVTADDPETMAEPDIDLAIATNTAGFFEGAGAFPGLQPGWLISVTYGPTTQTHIVRDISITDVDRATDVVRGTADPGTEVWVDVSGAVGVVATADSSGEWAADFAALYDITIGSEVGVQQEDVNGNGTHFGYEVPFPPIAIPAGTSLTTASNGTVMSGTPTVYWQDSLTVSTTGGSGGTGTATLTMSDGYVQTMALIETPASSGTYTGTFAAPYPHHGPASISFTIDYPDGSDLEGSFTLYIDPSGVVRDSSGDPVAGATVTLYRSVDPDGPFVAVADGSAIMSPGNRTNPDLTGVDGLFGWDVVAGYYKVRAEKPGCFAPSGGSAFVETGVLTIPPPVTDLVLVLDCLVAPTTLTYTGDTQVISPANTTLRATLVDSESACNVVGKTVNFYIDLTGDGDFNDAGESIGSAQTVAGTNNSAQATLSPSPTLQPGIYLVRVGFAGTSGCAGSEDVNGIVSVVTPGDAASGGGWYQIAGVAAASKSVNFGFGTRWDATTRSFTGQILIHNKQEWRLKGEITSFARTSSNPATGTVSGTAQLYRWQVVSPGLYDYVLVDSSVTFKVTFKDERSCKKGEPACRDSITVNWIIDYNGGAVSPLVTGATFQPLKGGNITIR